MEGDPSVVHHQLLQQFFDHWSEKNVAEMEKIVDVSNLRLSDPLYDQLKSDEIISLWKFYCSRPQFNLECKDVSIEEHDVVVRTNPLFGGFNSKAKVATPQMTTKLIGVAEYTISYQDAEGRLLTNDVNASFEFKNKKIVEITNKFDLWTWAKQTQGVSGSLLGWTSTAQATCCANAAKELEEFTKSNK
eukprot:TRINITY_DN1457_c0_g1_i1.p1 TRINITY_DN1457_c0_g1~~TRINITY_DN1457_c0_g1_i1.p1  ORF type:complete len:189 (-),score=47.62 TRINITY_DN1457_c0_g1_i1:146-712(-)